MHVCALPCWGEVAAQHPVVEEQYRRLGVASEGLVHERSALSSWTTAAATLQGSLGTTHVFVFTLTTSSRKVYGLAPASFGPQPMNIRMMWGFLGWITAA